MNTPVSFEIAKLLKEKRYPFEFITVGELEEVPLNIPTIAEVVMWLHEKHEIWVIVIPELLNGVEIRYYPSVFEQGIGEDIEVYYNSPTEAYEAAIEYCLTNLIK